MPDTASVGQRFMQLIQQLGMSKNAFALSLDKTATVIQHLVDERNKPGFDLMNKVLEVYPNVSADWLLRGNGPMMRDATATLGVNEAAPISAAATPTKAIEAAATPSFPAPLFAVSTARVSAPLPAAEVELPVAAPQAPPAPIAPVAPEVAAAAPPPAQASTSTEPLASPAAVAAPVATLDAATLTAALHAQHLQHQLALAEQRNQHLLEQQKLILERQALMQQMLDLMRRPA